MTEQRGARGDAWPHWRAHGRAMTHVVATIVAPVVAPSFLLTLAPILTLARTLALPVALALAGMTPQVQAQAPRPTQPGAAEGAKERLTDRAAPRQIERPNDRPAERPATPKPADLNELARAADRWVARGQDTPEAVLKALRAAWPHPPAGIAVADWQRVLWRTQGLVAARSALQGPVDEALAGLEALAEAGQRRPPTASASPGQPPAATAGRRRPGLAAADAALVRAVAADHLGQAAVAATAAREADALYAAACPGKAPPPACDHRHRWRALHMLTLRAESQGLRVDALALAQRAFDLAAAAGDLLPQAQSAVAMAVLHQALGATEPASRMLSLAERLARRHVDDEALVRVRLGEARVLHMRQQPQAARRALEDALRLARSLDSPRLSALIVVNLTDAWLREKGRAAQALAAIQQALPVMRRHRDLRNQPVLLHNQGLARIQLGQIAPGRADLEAALALWQQIGARGELEGALHEYADALAAAGDWRGALELHHRERRLREELMRGDQDAQLTALRTRFRSEAERLELSLLERENALKTTRLHNQDLQRRIWAVAASLLLVAAAVLAVLVKRTRDTNRLLRQSQALLKLQSERDPLTGLANRRHLREVLAVQAARQGNFQGSLLLLDVDHFKRVNDDHGHAAGDRVLQEVARRLAAEVRNEDVLCRWGGEEFLVLAPGLAGEPLDRLAQRLLAVVGDAPVALPDAPPLAITASLGYGGFPLAGQGDELRWEAAVNLVDMALYTAKGQGRDCAVGLLALNGADAATVAADFESARVRGQVSLRVQGRPAPAG